ncbi:MAG: hypothetical protein ABMA25_03840 [Ilumatobacteraceae bacterium]
MALIPVAALLLGACSDDLTSSTDTAQITSPAGSLPAGTDPAVETTVADDTMPEDTTPVTAVEGPVQIDVVVGVDSGEDRIVKVTVGADITLNITNPNADDEYHVHGIDIEQAAAKGEMATINFTITEAGTYEVESHITEDVLVIIEAA